MSSASSSPVALVPAVGTSWTHRFARLLVRPFLGTALRPNHLTTLRLLTGIAACIGYALGTPQALRWGGALWIFSALLDRADGELARIGNLATARGHQFDYVTDTVVNSAVFIAMGIGLRSSELGAWAIALGLLTGAAMLLCELFCEWLEARSSPGTRAYSGRWGFDPDDGLYLLGPLAWLGWLAPLLVAAAIGTTFMMALTGLRLLRMRRAAISSAS